MSEHETQAAVWHAHMEDGGFSHICSCTDSQHDYHAWMTVVKANDLTALEGRNAVLEAERGKALEGLRVVRRDNEALRSRIAALSPVGGPAMTPETQAGGESIPRYRSPSVRFVPGSQAGREEPRAVVVRVLVDDGRDDVALAELVSDALVAGHVRYVGEIEVSR